MKPYSDLTKIIHREGYIFIIIFLATTFLFASFNSVLGCMGAVATLWCAYFFRDPNRVTPCADNLVIGVGDGVVQSVIETEAPSELKLENEKMVRISVFLNIFNVHVQRIPVNGKVVSLHYNPGKFFNASLDKASKYNERQSVLIETKSGKKVVCVQIAGLIARRIVCDLEEETEVNMGNRYGIIRFGSRVDVYLPKDSKILVSEGQTCIAGETILAELNEKSETAPQFVHS